MWPNYNFLVLLLASFLADTCNGDSLPRLYFTSRMSTCSRDSPELYAESIALPALTSTLEEGKVFFGVLMDHLQESLEGSEELTEALQETWSGLAGDILDTFETSTGRIGRLWEMIVETWEADPVLPWEAQVKPTVLAELFGGLGHEYLMIDAQVKTGVRRIITTLQGYLKRLVKRLEVKMLGEDVNQGAANATELMQKMEGTIEEEEPTFVGSLLLRMIRRSKAVASGTWAPPRVSFVSRTLEQTAILIQAFREKSGDYPGNFWVGMTGIMKEDDAYDRTIPTQKLYALYSSSEDLVLNTLLGLITH